MLRKLFRGLIYLLLFLVTAIAGVCAYGNMGLPALDARVRDLQKEVTARSAALRMPVLRGQAPLDEDALTLYFRATKPLEAEAVPPSGLASLARSTLNEGRGPMPATLTAHLEERRAVVAALRDATRATRCDWMAHIDADTDVYKDAMNFWVPMHGARLLLLEARERAIAGDVDGAVERLVDALRLGADLAQNDADYLLADATREIGHLLEEGRLRAAHLVAFDAALAAIEPAVRDRAIGTYRLRLAGFWRVGQGIDVPGSRSFTADPVHLRVLRRAVVGLQWRGLDEYLTEADAAAALDDPDARAARCAEMRGRREGSWNVGVHGEATWVPNEDRVRVLARIAALRGALAVARFRAEKGAFPATLAEAMPEPARDPFAKAPVRYERAADGARARVYSVGMNRNDDGGVSSTKESKDDIAFAVAPGA